MRSLLPVLSAALFAFPALGTSVRAQTMSPMRGIVRSMADAFAVKVFPSNPYQSRINVEIHVYDKDFYEIEARITPERFTLAAGDFRQVTVLVPFDGEQERKVRICTESIPFPSRQTNIRTQICGKFIGRRVLP